MYYDCMIIGGGIAGLQAAIQLGRYSKHKVLVIDGGYGRSTLCRSYHNVLGWPEGISGEELRRLGGLQAERLGVHFVIDEVIEASRKGEGGFRLVGKSASGAKYEGQTLLLATGVMDRLPDLVGLKQCLGVSVYVCPDCDGYEIQNSRTIVLGSGKVGAEMALTLTYWTNDLVYINHEQQQVSIELMEKLSAKGIQYVSETIKEVITEGDGLFHGVTLHSGERILGKRGFVAFGGNEVKSSLAKQLGVERLENKHIITDPRSKMTSSPHVWAAGDVGVHAEQVTIAMGEGAQAAIWIHKALMQL